MPPAQGAPDNLRVDPAAERLAPLLAQLVNYERTRPDRRLWDLATMRALLARPGAPPPPDAAAGRRAGIYTSPHIHTLLERIQVDGRDIRVEQLEPLLRTILAAPAGERAPTFFEAMTLAAAEWFAQQRVELAIYEVGLGGRHDATTALPVDAGIVTMIELEHTDVLGDTIAQIAAEKAPVIRTGGTGFTGTTGAAFGVVQAHCVANGARLFALDRDFGLRAVRWTAAGAEGRLWLQDGRELPFVLPGAAAFELPALALAASAFVHLLPGAELVLAPAPRPQLPCRFEVRAEADGEVLVLDGAHTEQSLRLVGAELRRRWPGRKAALLFGSATGKRWQQGLSALLEVVDSVVVTELVGTTGEDPAAIAAFLTTAGVRNERVADAAAGLRLLRSRPGPRLVAGSFYLAGQVRALVDAEPCEPPR
jgi:dihydrofolate synthase / folylpolyglutamate synthase